MEQSKKVEADLAIVASMQNAYSIYEHGVHNNCEAAIWQLQYLLSPALCSGARQPVHLRLSVVCRNPYTLYKKRSPTVVRIVERRGGICCCKNTLFYWTLQIFFFKICLSNMDFNVKSSNFQGLLLVSYARFRKISYLCPRIKAFFAYCKIQKRAEVRSFPYCYLYYKGKRLTS